MSILKSALTSVVLITGVLVQQYAIAYPKSHRSTEIDFLKASFENLHGTMTPEIANYLESQYDANDHAIHLMLSGGYSVCDGIQQANDNGLDSQTLIEQEMSTIHSTANAVVQVQGVSVTEEQITMIYNTAHSHLCPELY